MSTIAEFFIAPDDDAAATVVGHGPDGDEVARYGNFSPDIAMGEWESAFGIVRDDGPRTLAHDGDSFVFAASASLQAALAAANREQLTQAAVRWAELRADDDEEIHPEFASDILSEMASLARTATERGHRLYCWWG